jgi:hypothetical protein
LEVHWVKVHTGILCGVLENDLKSGRREWREWGDNRPGKVVWSMAGVFLKVGANLGTSISHL